MLVCVWVSVLECKWRKHWPQLSLKFDQRCQKGCDHLHRTGEEAGEECIEGFDDYSL